MENLKYTSTQRKIYRDSNGEEYKEGDIVYNPCIGDYWVVRCSIPKDNTLCPYQLVLWDSRNEYYMDLDEPIGFVIVRRKGDKEYKSLLKSIHRIKKHRREEDRCCKTWYKVLKVLLKVLACLIFMSLFVLSAIFIPVISTTITVVVILILLFIYFYTEEG